MKSYLHLLFVCSVISYCANLTTHRCLFTCFRWLHKCCHLYCHVLLGCGASQSAFISQLFSLHSTPHCIFISCNTIYICKQCKTVVKINFKLQTWAPELLNASVQRSRKNIAYFRARVAEWREFIVIEKAQIARFESICTWLRHGALVPMELYCWSVYVPGSNPGLDAALRWRWNYEARVLCHVSSC